MKKLILLTGLLLGIVSNSFASQTVSDVKRIYARILQSNSLNKPFPIFVIDAPIINAYNDGSRLVVYTGLLKFVHNQDELALVIGHELAHTKWQTEQRADEYGALYARAAGYNYCRGALMFKRFGAGDMPIHPPGAERWKAMHCEK